MAFSKPRKKCWPKIEANVSVVVYYGVATYVSKGIRSITFAMDAFVPIVVRNCTGFYFDFTSPWVFPRWLIEMAVDN